MTTRTLASTRNFITTLLLETVKAQSSQDLDGVKRKFASFNPINNEITPDVRLLTLMVQLKERVFHAISIPPATAEMAEKYLLEVIRLVRSIAIDLDRKFGQCVFINQLKTDVVTAQNMLSYQRKLLSGTLQMTQFQVGLLRDASDQPFEQAEKEGNPNRIPALIELALQGQSTPPNILSFAVAYAPQYLLRLFQARVSPASEALAPTIAHASKRYLFPILLEYGCKPNAVAFHLAVLNARELIPFLIQAG